MLGALLEVQLRKICTTPARESDLDVKIVKNWWPFWRSKWFSCGRRRHFDTLQNTWQAQEFVRVAKTLGDLRRVWNDSFRVAGARISCFAMSMFEASDAESVEGLQISCHGSVTLRWSFRVAVLQDFVCLGSTFSWQAQYFWSIHLKIVETSTCHFWRKSCRKALFLSFKASIFKEVSQKSFVFELQSLNFEGSLAEMLRFWASKLQFWRKSCRKALFLSFKASIFKEVSQKSFVFELQSLNFEGSLANASFLNFKASILKEVLQKSFVFELQSFNFKEVSQKSFVFELQSLNFEGSLAEMLRFWASKLQFWRKSCRKALFLSFKVSILKEVSHKSFVFELQSFNFEGSLAEMLRLTKSFESHISWQPNHLNLKSFDIQIIWISNQLTTNSFESQIDWQPNHLNLRSIDNRITWIWNQLTTTSLEVQINKQPKSFEAHIDWQPNHLNLKSIDNQINWISNQMTTKSFDSQFVWIWHRPTFEPIELRTLPSYRFLIFGNFRHRLVR